MNEFLTWLANNPSVTTTLIVLIEIYIAVITLMYLVAFFQGRPIFFWPPKIGALPDKPRRKTSNDVTPKNEKITEPAPLFDLNGVWLCDDGATYYIRQVDREIFWLGELSVESPQFCNVAFGTVEAKEVKLQYADIPKGTNRFSGTLTLSIYDNGTRMKAVVKNGEFGGMYWIRRA